MSKLISWIDKHGMFAHSLFLLLFIPLYPKIPLFEAIPGYLVRVRLEDVFVGMIGLFWLIQVIRKKVSVNLPMLILVIGYILVGLISLLVAVFLQQTIPLQMLHVGKSALHLFRYLEYFLLFFFMYSGVKNKQHVKIAVFSLVASVALISVYGFGQKFLAWPVYSTMNREASKGIAQTLDQFARVHSTFGGHYDLAAYLVISLPILLALVFYLKNIKAKLISAIVFCAGTALLLLSASKMAFLAFLVAIAWILVKKFKFKYIFGLGILGIIISSIFLVTIAGKYKDRLINKVTDSEITSVQNSKFDETWSENTRKYGLSMGIRLDTLWPQALYGFSFNPWTGKGYATLNKLAVGQFTESDSTDNNYLRVLGETGILGFVFFFAAISYLFINIKKNKPQDDIGKILRLGYLAGFLGLLINALIIDVFLASKVAFTFWAISGLVLKSVRLNNKNKFSLQDKELIISWFKKLKTNYAIIFILVIFILLFHKIPFSKSSPIQSFSYSQDSAINARAAICLSKNLFTCQDLISRASLYSLPYIIYLIPFYFVYSHPGMYYFANLTLALFFITAAYTLAKKFKLKQAFVFVALTIIIIFGLKNNLSRIILNNFRDNYDAHQFRAVNRMNILAESNIDTQIITYLNPDYLSLFRKSDYEIINYDPNLEINNFDNLYFSNASKRQVNNADIKNDLNFSKKYYISLESIDCEHRCNVFKVFPKSQDLNTEAISANSKSFAKQENYKIILASNKFARFFNPNENPVGSASKYKNLLNSLQADGFIFAGTSTSKVEANHGQYFRKSFSDQINQPVIFAISDHEDSSFGPARQKFLIKNKLFLILDDNLGDPKDDQKKLFFDTLLQLYQHPEVKDLVIISNSLDWTEQLTEKDRAVAAQYSENLDINWHILADESSLEKSPNDILSFIENDFEFINTYFIEEPVNRVWVLDISKEKIEIESKKLISNL